MDSFQMIREDAIAYLRKTQEDALKKCLEETGISDTFAYNYNFGENKFTIYTTKPGIWIGLHGKTLDKMKEILSREYKEGCNIELKEIRGHFMNV